MPGIYEFYMDRLSACHKYGFKAGEELLSLVHSCVYHDAANDMLTPSEFMSIIKQCEITHQQLLEEDFNNGWNE